MQRKMLKSKIHRARVTEANLDYEGSISIDTKLCEMADLKYFEQVEIYNCDNGERFATYVIPGKEGEICLNGAAARKVQRNDKVIIASYVQATEEEVENWEPKLVFVNESNTATKISHESL